MRHVWFIATSLAVLGTVMGVVLYREHKRKSLSKDDGFVWNTTIEKRLEEENK